MAPPAALLAVDGGNSKSELLLVTRDGTLLAHRRGPTISHQAIATESGLSPAQRAGLGMERLAALAAAAAGEAGLDADARPLAGLGALSLAGADFPSDIRVLRAALGRQRLVGQAHVMNDAFAPLRAGTDRSYGIAVICGAGVNAAGIAPNGRTARFAALGDISGDWGGGTSIGQAALAAAVRARDGRGERTALESAVPLHFGLRQVEAVTRQLYDGRIAQPRLRELSPVVFAAAAAGDRVARGITDRLADELATMVVAIARRLRMQRLALDVVLAGGVFRARDTAFVDRITDRVVQAVPRATLTRLEAPPVLGTALIGLDHLGAPSSAATRLRGAVATLR
jgi:N-acetylglucosamine kinase-like BadF-type ATPase